MKMIRVLVCPVDEPPYVDSFTDDESTAKKLLGDGTIRCFRASKDAMLVYNHTKQSIHQLNPAPFNLNNPVGFLRGQVFFCGIDQLGNTASIPGKEARVLLRKARYRWRQRQEESK